MENSMNKKISFTQDAYYFVKASSNANGYRIPNGLATIYKQSDKAIAIPEKGIEKLDQGGNAETAFDAMVQRLRELYKNAMPIIKDIPEPSENLNALESLKELCDKIK